ncbi:PEP-CTERM sorting domain-containing protein [Luteolibacter sp. Populi]|uniref:PEP-CTERM sorting domain-containing protein n=1 Tax=Luteolibacter sp. Populi TaxID=3230487 RepID=UPI003465C79B
MKSLPLLKASILSLVLAATSQAAVIAAWDFDPMAGGTNNFGASPLSATTTFANVTAGGLTRGSGIGTTGTGAANGWGGNDFVIVTPSFATAVAANEFATFTIAPDADYELSLSDIGAYNIRRSGTGPSTGQWQYQLNAGEFQDIGTAITWGAVTTSSGNAQASIDLTGISELQNIAADTTVTFRLVAWGATNTGGTFYLNDPLNTSVIDFSLNGTVTAVPEPAAVLLGAIGFIGLLRRRR